MAVPSMAELLPPGFKFDPEDDEFVAHYLLPRLRGHRLPFDGIIVEADPLSAPPWELLQKCNRKNDAFFFAAGHAKSRTDSRQRRTCAGGGCWKGQKRSKTSVDGEKLVVPGTGEEIAWRKYLLNFHADGEQGSTGWVMDEYAVTAPADLAALSVMAYHIRFTGYGQNSKKRKREPETQDSVAGKEARTTLPPLEDYTSPAHHPVRQEAYPEEATPLEQGWPGHSGVMDSARFEESTDDLVNCDWDVREETTMNAVREEATASEPGWPEHPGVMDSAAFEVEPQFPVDGLINCDWDVELDELLSFPDDEAGTTLPLPPVEDYTSEAPASEQGWPGHSGMMNSAAFEESTDVDVELDWDVELDMLLP